MLAEPWRTESREAQCPNQIQSDLTGVCNTLLFSIVGCVSVSARAPAGGGIQVVYHEGGSTSTSTSTVERQSHPRDHVQMMLMACCCCCSLSQSFGSLSSDRKQGGLATDWSNLITLVGTGLSQARSCYTLMYMQPTLRVGEGGNKRSWITLYK